MSTFATPAPFASNNILASLSEGEFNRLSPHLEPVTVLKGEVLFESRTPTKTVYFPFSGVISMVVVSSDIIEIEAGIIGREGIVNPSGGLAGRAAVARALVQFDGAGWMLPNAIYNREFNRGEGFQSRVLRFQQTLLGQTVQSVLCNRLHSVEQRLLRWLLAISDRVNTQDLQMTHRFLAAMMGCRRESISVTLAGLRSAGLIETRPGNLLICDRAGLEARCCECYGITRQWLQFNLQR